MSIAGHPSINKGCAYFGIKCVVVGIDPVTMKINLDEVRNAINPNTVAIVGSAPSWPHGTVDDIPALAKMAKKH